MSQPTVVIAGVGPGLGASVARRFASEGCAVALLARSGDYLDELADDLAGPAVAAPTDITDADQVDQAFRYLRDELGAVDVLVNNASGGGWGGLRDLTVEAFESAWRNGPYGAFLCSKAALPDMLEANEGTIIFTGATSAVRGRADAMGFASSKYAVRGMASSMARELGPRGIHVAHAVIDGQIRPTGRSVEDLERDPETYLDPDAIADAYWDLYTQDRSAWTLELDLRPHVEEF